MEQNKLAKFIVSFGAIVLASVRLIWPTLQIDMVTIGLLVVAILPWLSSILESAKFPGGWEIKFRDLERAGLKITTAAKPSQEHASMPGPSYITIIDQDPNLALVGLRIEIERRLVALAEKHQLRDARSMKSLFAELQNRGVLNQSALSGIQEIIAAGNQAAHGARVETGTTQWVLSTGTQILAALDAELEK